MTYNELRDQLTEAIRASYALASYCWVRDFDDSTVWFEAETRTGACHTFEATYTTTGDTVTIQGQATEVEEQTTWVPSAKVRMDCNLTGVRKSDADQNVFGWASVAVRKDGTIVVDSDGEHIPIDDLEAAAYEFTVKYRATGDSHRGESRGVLIESMVFTAEKIEKMGLAADALPQAWWVGFHIDDPADYALIEKGERLMFSVQGRAMSEPVS